MAIEFRCIRCGQRLRVPDEDVGKRARCPTCNAIVDIPGDERPASPLLLAKEKSDVIDYELLGDERQHVEITLDPGEVAVARSESLLWMTSGIALGDAKMESAGGGLLDKISAVGRRILTDSSLPMCAFCNVAEQREVVAFAPPQAGRLLPLHLYELDKQAFCNGNAILCAARGIEIKDEVIPIVSDVMPMYRLNGDGIAVLHTNGQLVQKTLKANRTISVKTSSIIGFTSHVTLSPYESQSVESQTSICIVHGPGDVWLQTGT